MDRCRLCDSITKPDGRQHIFLQTFKPALSKIIKRLTNLIIDKDDPFTKIVCLECFMQLIKFNSFRQKARNVDYRIRHFKGTVRETDVDDDYDGFDTYYLPIQIKIAKQPLEIETEIKKTVNSPNKGNDCSADQNCVNKTQETDSDAEKNGDKLMEIAAKTQNSSQHQNGRDNQTIHHKKQKFSNNNNNAALERNGTNKSTDIVKNSYNDRNEKSENSTKSTVNDRNPSGFECGICNKRFMYKSSFVRHSRTHTDKCNVCTHTDERPYKCNVCTKDFRQHGMLRKHLRTHIVARPLIFNNTCPFYSGITVASSGTRKKPQNICNS